MKYLSLVVALAAALAATPLVAEPSPTPTRTLGRVFARLKAGDEVHIAYFGGSITAAPGYRVKTFDWFKRTFPKAKLVEINAAIGGTGSDLGAFRCATDVIGKRPDLVFVEFNINDGSPANEFRKATMEGIVRQLWASETKPEIVFLYTTSRTLDHPRVSHPAVANYYGIPQIDLQPPLIEALKRSDLPKPTEAQLKDPKFDWKHKGQVFMSDAVHPNNLGHTIYADTIEAYLKTQVDCAPMAAPVLGPPMTGDEFAHVRMLPAAQAKLAGNWEIAKPTGQGRYPDGTINARQAGDTVELTFRGTAVGLFLNVQKDGGKFEWTIDDGKSLPADPKYGGPKGAKRGTVDTAPGRYFPRTHYAMLTCGLPAGEHTLRIKVLPEHDSTSTGHRLLIGYFLLGGLQP